MSRQPITGYGKAPGRKADTGTPVTPAPTRTAPANVAAATKIAADSYGQSGFAAPSSLDPGQKLNAKLSVINDPEGVLATVQDKGTSMDLGPQLRPVLDTQLPSAHGMKRQTADNKFGGDVPDVCGFANSPPDKQP